MEDARIVLPVADRAGRATQIAVAENVDVEAEPRPCGELRPILARADGGRDELARLNGVPGVIQHVGQYALDFREIHPVPDPDRGPTWPG